MRNKLKTCFKMNCELYYDEFYLKFLEKKFDNKQKR